LIYVEGRLEPSVYGKTSPVSYFCANLARLFRDSAMCITLPFFCGQHIASNDDLQGPRGLVRSLLSQLLQFLPNTPQGIDIAGFIGNHKSIPTEDLCQMFKLLVSQLSMHSTLFRIIDDLAQFEKDRWDEDYWHFLRMLDSALIVGHKSDIRFKVLITSSTKSKRLQEYFPEELRIQVTEGDRGLRDYSVCWVA
jgi:hypothetical protein